jgi:hypothetical protein
MKVTVVPAQVTTVEDRIIGNLGFSQMLLMIIPVFVSAGLFALLPPFMGSALYKYIIMAILAFVCCVLAIRIKGKIIALWLVTILRYNVRPKYYLFNKNTAALRQDYPPIVEPKAEEKAKKVKNERTVRPRLNTPQTAKVLATIENPAAKFRFETTKKGGLNVRLTEIEK